MANLLTSCRNEHTSLRHTYGVAKIIFAVVSVCLFIDSEPGSCTGTPPLLTGHQVCPPVKSTVPVILIQRSASPGNVQTCKLCSMRAIGIRIKYIVAHSADALLSILSIMSAQVTL